MLKRSSKTWMNKKKLNEIKRFEETARKCNLNCEQVQYLTFLYRKLIKQLGNMDRLHFRDVIYKTFDITDDLILDRIFKTFDKANDGVIDEEEWIHGLSVFLKGTLEEQIQFCYNIYDFNGDKSLSREELYNCLDNCLIRTVGFEEDVEESIKEIVDIAMKKLDVDKNGQITFKDFHDAVMKDPLLLEACGSCLPSQRTIDEFFFNVQQDFFKHLADQKKY